MLDRLRIGLVGCGKFAAVFGRFWVERAHIVALSDPDESAMQKTADALAIKATTYRDYREMFAIAQLEAVVVLAPDFLHRDITVAAAAAGLHVFCEKSMASTAQQCREMVAACEAANVRLMVGHKRRLRPSWARMVELCRDGTLGRPLAVTVTQYLDIRPYNYPGTWWTNERLVPGSFAIAGVHVIDWFASLLGTAVRVSAVKGPSTADGFSYPTLHHATIEFEGHALASINTSLSFPLFVARNSPGPMVQCENGGAQLDLSTDRIELRHQRHDETAPHQEFFSVTEDYAAAYRIEVDDFLGWVSGALATPHLTWREGLRCVETMEAIYRSMREDGAWMGIPTPHDAGTSEAII